MTGVASSYCFLCSEILSSCFIVILLQGCCAYDKRSMENELPSKALSVAPSHRCSSVPRPSDSPSRSRILDGTVIHIVERVLVLVGSCHMVGILKWILLFFVAYGRPYAPFCRRGVCRRFLCLVLFGAAMILQFTRVPVLNRSVLVLFAQFVSGDAAEDEEGEVDDAGSMILAIRHPPNNSRLNEKLTVAKPGRRWPQSPFFPEYR